MSKRAISPLDVYASLPRTNCKVCGEPNCMAFATKLINRETVLENCTPLKEEKYKGAYEKLWDILKPPVKEIIVGSGEKALKIGGKLVMYRHELSYSNPTALAVDVTDEMPEEEVLKRIRAVEGFSYDYIGQKLKLDLLAIRSVSSDPAKFASTVKKVVESTSLPLVLCSLNPEVIKAGLASAKDRRPLIYAATRDNWSAMADLALAYNLPLVVYTPDNLKLLRSVTKTLQEYGVEELVLDPGTLPEAGLGDTVSNLTIVRRAACKEDDPLSGLPILATPITVWTEYANLPEVAAWKEAYLASMLMTRYADILVMHSLDGWVLLPVTILRQNLYTDPRKPVAVESGLRKFGTPDKASPLLLTTNFALTYYTVASDIKSGGVNCHLLVVDTEGISVESAVAGRKLTAEGVAEALKQSKVETLVGHKRLIIPGRAARLSGEIESLTGWEVIVGPMDSSEIPKFLDERWSGRTV